MSYEIVFTRRAARDLEEAAAWYEKQKDLLSWELRENVITRRTNQSSEGEQKRPETVFVYTIHT